MVDLGQMKNLLLALQPSEEVPTRPLPCEEAEEDSLSIAAFATHFSDLVQELSQWASGSPAHSSTQSSLLGINDGYMARITHRALPHLQLDVLQATCKCRSGSFSGFNP